MANGLQQPLVPGASSIGEVIAPLMNPSFLLLAWPCQRLNRVHALFDPPANHVDANVEVARPLARVLSLSSHGDKNVVSLVSSLFKIVRPLYVSWFVMTSVIYSINPALAFRFPSDMEDKFVEVFESKFDSSPAIIIPGRMIDYCASGKSMLEGIVLRPLAAILEASTVGWDMTSLDGDFLVALCRYKVIRAFQALGSTSTTGPPEAMFPYEGVRWPDYRNRPNLDSCEVYHIGHDDVVETKVKELLWQILPRP